MAKYVIDSATLTAIADSIRAKKGTTANITPQNMPSEIAGITTGESLDVVLTEQEALIEELKEALRGKASGGGDVEPIVFSYDAPYGCAGALGGVYIKNFGNTISTSKLTTTSYMFYKCTAEEIPFEINFAEFSNYHEMINMFEEANIKSAPKMNNCKPEALHLVFNGCKSLREIPENYFDDWNFSRCTGNNKGLFQNCYSLRKYPTNWFRNLPSNASYSNAYFGVLANNNHSLDELVNLPIPYTSAWSINAFNSFLSSCYRLKNLTFETPNGQPVVVKWKSQTIDLITSGYSVSSRPDFGNNSGITKDKEVKDDATYATLKNDPDWYTIKIEYSRYNHDSAVATINSLPDASAYLATTSATNTIKFRGEAGSKTDGGAINTLTEEEIAVATAKGWTVTLS